MDRLIKKLGKPKSFLVFFSVCLACGFIAAVGLGLHFVFHVSFPPIGPGAVKTIVHIGLFCWLTCIVCLLYYYLGQLAGKYEDLKGRGWSELPW